MHNQELRDGYLRLNVIYDAPVRLQLCVLWSEVSACFANCWQKIVIFPQEMLANIWHYTFYLGIVIQIFGIIHFIWHYYTNIWHYTLALYIIQILYVNKLLE